MPEVRAHGRDAPSERRGGEPVGAHRGDPALEVLDCRLTDAALARSGERREVAPVRVDGARRALRGEHEQEALDVEVGAGSCGGHGARLDSVGTPRLLSRLARGFGVSRSHRGREAAAL